MGAAPWVDRDTNRWLVELISSEEMHVLVHVELCVVARVDLDTASLWRLDEGTAVEGHLHACSQTCVLVANLLRYTCLVLGGVRRLIGLLDTIDGFQNLGLDDACDGAEEGRTGGRRDGDQVHEEIPRMTFWDVTDLLKFGLDLLGDEVHGVIWDYEVAHASVDLCEFAVHLRRVRDVRNTN